jgi:dTDP-4-dehydrorhamnose reductase
MNLLLLGAGGQLGRELTTSLAPVGEVHALDRRGADLTDLAGLSAIIRDVGADIIVNAAAYTHVDRAESERDLAFRVNGEAPAVLAAEAASAGALLVHFSTDYAFDGACHRPYVEEDRPAPLNVYGASKLAGDEAVLGSAADTFVFRISWVYSKHGRNFLKTIQQLARERSELPVVVDQYGSPSWARTIAEATTGAIVQWIESRAGKSAPPPRGLYHMAAPDHTTWHGFASVIVDDMEWPAGKERPLVRPITTAEYPTKTRRPRWTVLGSEKLWNTFGIRLPTWREQLADCLQSD